MKNDSTPENQSRRRLLKVLGAGGAAASTLSLPEKWAKPVVDAVLLPAHAQLTGVTPDFGVRVTLFDNGNVNLKSTGFEGYAKTDAPSADGDGASSIGGRLLDLLVPRAHAGEEPAVPFDCSFGEADLWVSGQTDSQGRHEVCLKLTASGCECILLGAKDRPERSILDYVVSPAMAQNGPAPFSVEVLYKGLGNPDTDIPLSFTDGCEAFVSSFCGGNPVFRFSVNSSNGEPRLASASLCGDSTGVQALNPNFPQPTSAADCPPELAECVLD